MEGKCGLGVRDRGVFVLASVGSFAVFTWRPLTSTRSHSGCQRLWLHTGCCCNCPVGTIWPPRDLRDPALFYKTDLRHLSHVRGKGCEPLIGYMSSCTGQRSHLSVRTSLDHSSKPGGGEGGGWCTVSVMWCSLHGAHSMMLTALVPTA